MTANPEVETISGLRVTGARGGEGRVSKAGATAEMTLTREQVMGKPKEFAETATPAAKIEALARDVPEDAPASPTLFRDLAKDQDPATQELAASYDHTCSTTRVGRSPCPSRLAG